MNTSPLQKHPNFVIHWLGAYTHQGDLIAPTQQGSGKRFVVAGGWRAKTRFSEKTTEVSGVNALTIFSELHQGWGSTIKVVNRQSFCTTLLGPNTETGNWWPPF